MTIVERPPTGPAAPARVETRRNSSQLVGGGILVLIGVMWLLERTGVIDISVTAVLALATMVIGITLMLLSRERAPAGLIVFGTILAAVTLVTATAPFEGFQGGIGDRTVELTSVDDIQSDYNLAMGKLTIDLRAVDDFDAASPLTASVGLGELVLRVPKGVELDLDASIGAGQLEILGRVIDGVGLDETYRSPGFTDSNETMTLDLQVFAGRVEVTDE